MVAGDWNVDSQIMQSTLIHEQVKGAWLCSGQPALLEGRPNELDYALVAQSVFPLSSVTLDWDGPRRPHATVNVEVEVAGFHGVLHVDPNDAWLIRKFGDLLNRSVQQNRYDEGLRSASPGLVDWTIARRAVKKRCGSSKPFGTRQNGGPAECQVCGQSAPHSLGMPSLAGNSQQIPQSSASDGCKVSCRRALASGPPPD